jgi:glycosyltransferase involved in cell wall biosynthesis
LKVLEARAMERAIVATPVGTMLEIIQDGKTGIIAEPETQCLAASCLELFDDASLRRSLGTNARQSVVMEYSWEIAARSLLFSYRLAVSGARR